MSTRPLMFTLIIITAAIFALALALSKQFELALIATLGGVVWGWLERSADPVTPAPFLLFFIVIAILGTVIGLPAPVMLFGVGTALAAWDLIRFHRRAASAETHEIDPELEKQHFQRLLIVICAGLVLALPPLLIRLSVSFAGFAALTLVMMFVFRRSLILLRRDDTRQPD